VYQANSSALVVADLIRSISDPEHPLTLEQLAVVSSEQITVNHGKRPSVLVEFTPTIPHCSMATLIGALQTSPRLADVEEAAF
jgi:metal-sulfur cluster biosynthetic enzyme